MGCASSKNVVQPTTCAPPTVAAELDTVVDAVAPLSPLVSDFKTHEEGVGVLLRLRGLNTKEKAEGGTAFLKLQSSTQLRVPASKLTPSEHTFTYDAVLNESTSQAEVYSLCGPKTIEKALSGCHATIFAYGQTGSGKTHTVEGTPADAGIIPRLCEELFQKAAERAEKGIAVKVLASYIEIYQEVIRDLLTDSAQTEDRKPAIREHKKDGIYLENVEERDVSSVKQVAALLKEGGRRRAVGETNMNSQSSRSHAVLTLSIEQCEASDKEGLTALRSKINLIDLAGSERAKSTGAEGDRLKEGANINKSLSALGNVIGALTSSSRKHVPYRDSKLTRLLQDSLGGSAYCMVVCNISAASTCESETVSTLRFAERLKSVKNQVCVHLDARSRKILELQSEVMGLRLRVLQLEGALTKSGQPVPPGALPSAAA